MNPTPAGRRATIAAILFVYPLFLIAQQQRPPAVPLIAHDPYFSIWSAADHLTDKDTTHWTGHRQPIAGIARIDGKPYRFMGAEPRDVPAMDQLSLKVTPTHTIYDFQAAGVQLTVTFFTPAFPNDLDILSRPVTYLTLTARAESSHEVSVLIDVDPMIAVNTEDEAVTWGRSQVRSGSGLMTVMSIGSRDQRELNRPGDDVRIDWGYFHLASQPGQVAFAATTNDAIRKFTESGDLAAVDELDMPKSPRNGAAHLAIAFPLSAVSAPTSRLLMLSYTEQFNIEYLNRKLRPYWQRNGETVEDMLGKAGHEFKELDERGTKFDQDLTADLEKAGGPAYAQLAILAYRQTLAAHGFAADVDGTPMLFPKENFSNGCISTVDVLYPSAPFFLFFNPALLQAQLKPVLEYAAPPALEVALRPARPRHLPAGRRTGLRRRRAH